MARYLNKIPAIKKQHQLTAGQNNWLIKTLIDISDLSEIELNDVEIISVKTAEQLKQQLTEIIAYLIDHDFEKLLSVLYRIDVDEEKTKLLLSKHLPEEAPSVLAELIIQRQQKKEEVKNQFSFPVPDADDDLRL